MLPGEETPASNNAYKPYPEYKDSGLPWLGKIPAHWTLRRNGRLFAQRNETGFSDLPILEVSLKTGVRIRDFENSNRKQVMTDRDKYKRALKGDIAYNMMRLWQGAVGVSPVDGLISPAYVVARPFPDTVSRYYSYLFRTDTYKNEVNKYSHGIVTDRNRLYWDEFKQMPSIFPPPEEQKAIADYLDFIGKQIRQFIQNKRKLIELFKEQKQAIINQAVTRGIDPNVRLKPSGVEWLGDIPEHWEIRRLKFLIRRTLQYGANEPAEFNDPALPRFIRITDIDENGDLREETFCSIPEILAKPYLLKYGDILFARSGATVGKTFYCKTNWGKAAYAGYLIRAQIDQRKIDPNFIFFFTKTYTYWQWISTMFIKATIQNISAEKYASLCIPLPPLNEQHNILDRIREPIKQIDKSIAVAQREIELMREYRTRLIADVVTGKIDVRGIPVEPVEEGEGAEEIDTPEDVEEPLEMEEVQNADD